MSKPRHRAPAARRAELVQICRQSAPATYDHTPKNRSQRRALSKLGRKRGDCKSGRRE